MAKPRPANQRPGSTGSLFRRTSTYKSGAGVADLLKAPMVCPALTRAPGPGSPAVDAGDPAFVGPPFTDQRGFGFPRVINRLDIGALEARQIDLNIVKEDNVATAIPGQGKPDTVGFAFRQ